LVLEREEKREEKEEERKKRREGGDSTPGVPFKWRDKGENGGEKGTRLRNGLTQKHKSCPVFEDFSQEGQKK